jgi:cysteine desulfurase
VNFPRETAKLTIYLDYQASTPVDPRVAELVASISAAIYSNPHAEDHAGGWEASRLVEAARGQIAQAIGAEADEVIFTSGATEADNIAVLGAALDASTGRNRIIVSAFEHKAVLECAAAARRYGFMVETVPVTSAGIVDLDALDQLLGEDVAVVSVMAVNNEIGTIQPIPEVAARASRWGAFVHTDATQAPLAMAVDVLEWGVDAASFSSHKLYGPKGVGALYLSSSAPWRPRPLMYGGGQEQGLRPGTLPTALCAGFGLAITLLSADERRMVRSLRDRLATQLMARHTNLQVTCVETERHPGCLHLRLPGHDAKDVATRLQPALHISTGSACTSGVMHGSHVLLSLGWSMEAAQEGLRISLGRFTTEVEVDSAGALLSSVLAAKVV